MEKQKTAVCTRCYTTDIDTGNWKDRTTDVEYKAATIGLHLNAEKTETEIQSIELRRYHLQKQKDHQISV